MSLKSVNDLKKYNEILIFGASDAADEVIRYLNTINQTVVGFIDNDLNKKNKLFNGKLVHHPADLNKILNQNQAIIIASSYQYEITKQLIEDIKIPIDQVFPYINKMFSNHFNPQTYIDNTFSINNLRAKLCDNESNNYLTSLLEFRTTMDARSLIKNSHIHGFYHYDNPNMGPFEGDLIIDVGAFNGDSALSYLKRLNSNARILALEPFENNYKQLIKNINGHNLNEKIYPYNVAAGSEIGAGYLSHQANNAENPRAKISSNSVQETSQIKFETIDNLASNQANKIDFIKIDVEGFELDVLKGSQKTLTKDKPGLAIAAYHEPEHLWAIMELVDAIEGDYRFFLGHHPTAIYECELYAFHKSKARV